MFLLQKENGILEVEIPKHTSRCIYVLEGIVLVNDTNV